MSFSIKINKVITKYWLGASVYKNKQYRIIVNTTHLLVVERFYSETNNKKLAVLK